MVMVIGSRCIIVVKGLVALLVLQHC